MPHFGKQAAATLKEIRQNKRSCLATILWLCSDFASSAILVLKSFLL
jgi:hypothetical protein